MQESIPGIDPDSPRQYAKKNFPKDVAAAIIEVPFNKKAPTNTKFYKVQLRLDFHCAFMEDILKTFETYGPNPEIKERILTDDAKNCIQMCVYFVLFLCCRLQITHTLP